jgi:hypothetical protein
MGAGTVGGQTAVPDAWLEKVARMVDIPKKLDQNIEW